MSFRTSLLPALSLTFALYGVFPARCLGVDGLGFFLGVSQLSRQVWSVDKSFLTCPIAYGRPELDAAIWTYQLGPYLQGYAQLFPADKSAIDRLLSSGRELAKSSLGVESIEDLRKYGSEDESGFWLFPLALIECHFEADLYLLPPGAAPRVAALKARFSDSYKLYQEFHDAISDEKPFRFVLFQSGSRAFLDEAYRLFELTDNQVFLRARSQAIRRLADFYSDVLARETPERM